MTGENRMDKVRLLCVRLLVRCENSGYSNLLLKNAFEQGSYTDRDRQFASALVYGTLEKQRLLDAFLNLFLKKDCSRLDAPVRAILRSGLYQCRWMDGVPEYAAINTSVELTRAVGKSSAAGMVNAVLRKAAAADVKQLNFTSDIERLGTLYCVSDSIVRMLRSAYPQQAEEILSGFQCPSQTVLRINLLRTTPENLCASLSEEGFSAEPLSFYGAVVLRSGGDLIHTQAFQRGLFHVQGLTSQLAAHAVGAHAGEVVFDLCAAPGGKSLFLAQEMEDRGQLVCGELQPARVPLIEQQLARCGVRCAQVQCRDAAVFDPSLPPADAVLCDVPCSGSGILAKKPELRMKNLDTDRAQLCALQKNILDTASRYVRAGGRLVYSTCSLDPAENGAVVGRFLQEHSDFRLSPVEPGPAAFVRQGEAVTFLPLNGRNDGFYIAKMEKVCYTK